jgi:hypothetical protein
VLPEVDVIGRHFHDVAKGETRFSEMVPQELEGVAELRFWIARNREVRPHAPVMPEKKTKSPVSSPGEKCQSTG